MILSVSYVKHINSDENNRIEFLLVNFDYYDGNDIISKLFQENYNMEAEEKLDGIFFSIIKLHLDQLIYYLVWHEDVGNYIYGNQQSDKQISELEDRLSDILIKLNTMLLE